MSKFEFSSNKKKEKRKKQQQKNKQKKKQKRDTPKAGYGRGKVMSLTVVPRAARDTKLTQYCTLQQAV